MGIMSIFICALGVRTYAIAITGWQMIHTGSGIVDVYMTDLLWPANVSVVLTVSKLR